MKNLVNSVLIKENILNFEQALLNLPAEHKIDVSIKNYHTENGLYAREMHMPKNTMLSGAIHKYDHLCILNIGRITVIDEFEGKRELTAPMIFVSKAGVKRAFFAMENTIFTTVHKCTEIDELKIWECLVSRSYEEYSMFLEQEKLKLEANK